MIVHVLESQEHKPAVQSKVRYPCDLGHDEAIKYSRSPQLSPGPSPGLTRKDVSVTLPDPPMRSTPQHLPVNNLPARHQIPQLWYIPTRTRASTLENPVSFSVNSTPGISLSRAMAGDFTGLAGRDDHISSFKNSKTICRIQVGTTIFRTNVSLTTPLVH